MVDACTKKKSLVVLTRGGVEHRYVVNTLCDAFPIDRIIVDQQPSRPQIRRAARQGGGHLLSKAARSIFLKIIRDDKARDRALRRLFGRKGEAFYMLDKVSGVHGINSDETIDLLREINPDAILIYGTSVVNNAVLTRSRDLCFNMHTGISPYYRGTACSFWPLVNGELDMLGATIHECTSHIDGGKIFEITHVGPELHDDLHSLFGRTVIAGAEAYVRVVKRYLTGKLKGTPQDLTLGREYRGVDLTIGPELVARLRLSRMTRKA